MRIIKRVMVFLLVVLIPLVNIQAATSFVVRKIRIEGLQRITEGTVLSYLPIRPGETLNAAETNKIITSLYDTGFFSDVNLARQGDVLIIRVAERPTIGTIKITGNKKIQTKQLQEALKNVGLSEGNVYDGSMLSGVQKSLEHEYSNLGYYNATVNTDVTQQGNNRVAITIRIHEGSPAKIKEINIIGNEAFSDRKLLKNFKSSTGNLFSFFTHDNQYSQEKLNADLESLRSFYMDRGYLRFKVDSTQVSMSPDKKSVYIVIHVTEGAIYRIKGYELSGNMLGEEATLRKMTLLKPGEVFSRQKILNINNAITRYYGDRGYAFAQVDPIPTIDDLNHQVFVNFRINPGQRVYVRRISFAGNEKTQDKVLRREMRQTEGGLYSASNIEESKRRLSNLGYLEDVTPKTVPVPGHPNQVDLVYDVKEVSSATARLQVGYSDVQGIVYGANLNENNLMGTGKRASVGFSRSGYATVYSLSYLNPYYTQSGISRGFNLFSSEVTPGDVNVTPYTSRNIGGNVVYGLPISEYSSLNFGYGYQHIKISEGTDPSTQVADFINSHGDSFNQVTLTGGWSRSTYDRAILPTRGSKQMFNVEVGIPVLNDSLEYYRLNYQLGWYLPLPKSFILHPNASLGYANGYGEFNNDLPFFKNYFAGGIGSVRGYKGNTLGPQDSQGNPIGGNVLTTGSLNLIVPNPISKRLRTSLFFDAGTVYDNSFNLTDMRYSVGVGAEIWIPMVGPLQVSLAQPLSNGKDVDRRVFDFSVGTSF